MQTHTHTHTGSSKSSWKCTLSFNYIFHRHFDVVFYVQNISSIHISISRYWNYFILLAIMNNAAIKMEVKIHPQENDFNSFGCIPCRWCFSTIFALENISILFCIIIVPICIPTNTVLFSPTSCQHGCILYFLKIIAF